MDYIERIKEHQDHLALISKELVETNKKVALLEEKLSMLTPGGLLDMVETAVLTLDTKGFTMKQAISKFGISASTFKRRVQSGKFVRVSYGHYTINKASGRIKPQIIARNSPATPPIDL